jgi:hypothetical protein
MLLNWYVKTMFFSWKYTAISVSGRDGVIRSRQSRQHELAAARCVRQTVDSVAGGQGGGVLAGRVVGAN